MAVGIEIGLRNLVEDLTPELGGPLVGANINGVLVVDGSTHAQTGAGIQAAIDALPAGGGMVFMPAGSYVLAAGITVKGDDIVLKGAGPSTILSTSGMQDTFITTGGDTSTKRCRLCDFAIDATNQTEPGDYGIESDKSACGVLIDDELNVGCDDTIVERLYISHVKNEAIGIWGAVQWESNLFVVVQNNVLSDFGHRGIHTHIDCSTRALNNTLRDSNTAHLNAAIRHGHIISGNVIHNVVHSWTEGEGSHVILGSDMESIITGNMIIDCDVTQYGIHTWIGAEHGDLVANNLIYGGSMAAAIHVYKNDMVLNNRIIGFADIVNGIGVGSGEENARVVGNHITGMSGIGISSSSADVVITGNIVDDPDAVGTDYAIYLTTNAANAIVRDNVFLAGYAWMQNATILARGNSPLRTFDGVAWNTYPFTLTAAAPTIRWWMSSVLLDATGNVVDAVLPDPTAWPGESIIVKAIDVTNSCKISPFSGENIDGAVQEITFHSANDAVTVQSDGTDWWIVDSHIQHEPLRVVSWASGATITIDADVTDHYNAVGITAETTFAVPSGTPVDGQKLTIRIEDDGTGRALNWNAIFEVVGQTLPVTTTAAKKIYVGLIYNTTDTKWDVVAIAEEA